MKAFLTLGGVLSVRLTVTLCGHSLERVANGVSLLLSAATPLPPLLPFLSPFPFLLFLALFVCSFTLAHPRNPLFCFSYLFSLKRLINSSLRPR